MDNGERSDRFRISLYDNGVHSLRKGLKAYDHYSKDNKPLLLKDAIMGLHHGIELLFKEMLVRRNQFLIFEDLRNVAKKQKQADQISIGIFFIDSPPKTVSFTEAIARVDAFLSPNLLDRQLLTLLDELNKKRNQLEHYTINADIDEIDRLLADIKDPLLELLQISLGGIPELRENSVEKIWNDAKQRSDNTKRYEERIKVLMHLFDNQIVPGKFFSFKGELTLPKFDYINNQYTIPEWPLKRFDLFGKSDRQNWAVEIKSTNRYPRNWGEIIMDLDTISKVSDAKPWIVLNGTIPDSHKTQARRIEVLVSTLQDIVSLEDLLDP